MPTGLFVTVEELRERGLFEDARIMLGVGKKEVRSVFPTPDSPMLTIDQYRSMSRDITLARNPVALKR